MATRGSHLFCSPSGQTVGPSGSFTTVVSMLKDTEGLTVWSDTRWNKYYPDLQWLTSRILLWI